MKFASYLYNQSDKPRFGFKRDKYIVDVVKCANWLNEKKGDAIFLDIPSSLKDSLKNWRKLFIYQIVFVLLSDSLRRILEHRFVLLYIYS